MSTHNIFYGVLTKITIVSYFFYFILFYFFIFFCCLGKRISFVPKV